MSLNWTVYDYTNAANLYNDSTYFKTLFTETTADYNEQRLYTSDDFGFVTDVEPTYNTHGYRNNKVDGTFTTNTPGFNYIAPFKFAEEKLGNNYVFVWKDNTAPSYYLMNSIFDIDANTKGALIAGNNISGNYVGAFLVEGVNSTIPYDVVSAYAAANSYTSDYVIQPICVGNVKTPLYFVSGITILDVGTEFSANGKNFLVIAKGVAIEIPKED